MKTTTCPAVLNEKRTQWVKVNVEEVRRLLIDQGMTEREIRSLRIRIQRRGLLSGYALAFLWGKTVTLYTSHLEELDPAEAQDLLQAVLCHELRHYMDRHNLVDRLFNAALVLEWVLRNVVVVPLLTRKAVRRFGKRSLLLILPLAYAGNVVVQQVAYQIHPAERRARAFQAQDYRLVLLEEGSVGTL